MGFKYMTVVVPLVTHYLLMCAFCFRGAPELSLRGCVTIIYKFKCIVHNAHKESQIVFN